MPITSVKKRRLSSPFGVNISTGPRCASSDTGLESIQLEGQRAGLQLRALVGLLGRAGSRRVQNLLRTLGGHDGDAVGVEHDQVAGLDRRAANGDRHVE